jgi:hypothetical protein
VFRSRSALECRWWICLDSAKLCFPWASSILGNRRRPFDLLVTLSLPDVAASPIRRKSATHERTVNVIKLLLNSIACGNKLEFGSGCHRYVNSALTLHLALIARRSLMKPATVVLILSSAFFGPSARLSAADPLFVAAKERQAAAKTVVVRFSASEFYANGSVNATERLAKGTIPAEDTTLESADNSLKFDESKVRLETNQPIWHVSKGIPVEYHMLTVVNGKHSKMYFPNGMGNDGVPEGIIGRNATTSNTGYYILTPLTTHFRGADPYISPYILGEARATGKALPINDFKCTEYILAVGDGMTASLWADAEHGYAIRRVTRSRLGKMTDQVDIAYREEPGFGPVPATWTRNVFDAEGHTIRTLKVEVTEIKINGRIPADQFEFEFPTNCRVCDQRNGKNYRILSDGNMQEVGPTGEDLSTVVPQPDFSWFRRHRGLLAGLAITCFLIGLAAFARLRRNRRPGNENLQQTV